MESEKLSDKAILWNFKAFVEIHVFTTRNAMVGNGKNFNNTRVKHRVKGSVKVPAISNKLADMIIIDG
uniref:Zn-cluster domain-containing protein n=1 Tax=Cucumis melo TaxID=3656 RepID=A0A9I9E6I3_CUCME